jgi:hypothetical protein
MSERDVMQLLAGANPVRVEDLAPLSFPDLSQRRLAGRRVVVAIAVVAAAVAASLTGVFAFNGSPSPHPGSGGFMVLPLPTLAHPLPPGAKQTSLPEAAQALGAPIVLPDSSLAAPSDAGAVWIGSMLDERRAAVTFPSAGLIVLYWHPRLYANPGSLFAAVADGKPGVHALDLEGVAALAIDQNSDSTGTNFGSIEFDTGGTTIAVLGHYDQATLQAVAQSIVDRSAEASPSILAAPGSPATPVADAAAADALLSFKVVLPSDTTPTSLGVLEQGHQLDAYFDTPASGPYILVEGPSTETVAMLRETAKRWTVGPIHEIDVVDGVDVLLQGSSDGSLVASWIRLDGGSKILTWVKGPETAERGQVEGTFTKQRALAIAADIIAQGG